MPRNENENGNEYSFDDLIRVMEALLSEDGGCPWDREQTHESLKRYMIEEAYETLEAIDAKDGATLCEELGDVLLQVVFHAAIAESFNIGDVISGVCQKMVSRHPHVFGALNKAAVKTSSDVLTNWEKIKRGEMGLTGHTAALKRVPSNLPALMRAYKVQQKARDAGFDWVGAAPVFEKAKEEMAELQRAIDAGDPAGVEEEFGDLLFALVNLSRFIKVYPEFALTSAVEKFIRRFGAMEDMVAGEGRSLDGMTLAEMDVYWDRVKSSE